MGECRGAAKLWEAWPGAATAPLPGTWQRREPEKTVLHQVVADHLESFLRAQAAEDHAVPRFVEKELRAYLSCGLISEGFTRVKCFDCTEQVVVGFSCKGRAFCPSCCARRMHDTAFHLDEQVLPKAPYRQWVLSYPYRVRLALARDAKAAGQARRILMSELFRHQRRQAKREGIGQAKPGGISFTQRFGSKLNLNVHLHNLLPDGVFTAEEDGSATFHELSGPKVEDLERILVRVIRRTQKDLHRRGLLDEPDPDDALARLQAEAVQQARLPWPDERQRTRGRLVANLDGYSLEAGTHVHAGDRAGLLHLCRYALRSPFSKDRLQLRADGKVELTLRRPAPDGVRAVVFTPQQFLRRLAALVPPPRFHLVGYHGVFAGGSKLRAAVVPDTESAAWPVRPATKPGKKPRRMTTLPWAELHRRVFLTDVLACPCGGTRRVVAFVKSPKLAQQALTKLGIAFQPLRVAKAREPPSQADFDLRPSCDGVDPCYPD
jgi:hypothetical protein